MRWPVCVAVLLTACSTTDPGDAAPTTSTTTTASSTGSASISETSEPTTAPPTTTDDSSSGPTSPADTSASGSSTTSDTTTQLESRSCDPDGACMLVAVLDCAPFACDPQGLICHAACANDGECAAGNICMQPLCVPM